MPDRDVTSSLNGTNAHAEAAEAFVERVRSRFSDELKELYLFGSTARGEARGLASDVDVLIVGDDANRDEIGDALRELAFDVMVEYGPVVELRILSQSTFEHYRNEGNPSIQNVITEGRPYLTGARRKGWIGRTCTAGRARTRCFGSRSTTVRFYSQPVGES